ncbi:MAG: transposase, partial [Pseudomonadota bacterium]|nr:transposase [Pseudomonadota bacterium]
MSKRKIDCAWLRDRTQRKVKTRGFANDPAGFEALLDWVRHHTGATAQQLHFILEATGVYHEALAYALHSAGAQVSVVNPAQARRYAESFGRRAKTDKKDSVILAWYGATQQPRLWQPEAEEVRILKALVARLEAVENDIQRESNRLEKARFSDVTPQVARSIRSVLSHLEDEKQRLLKDIDQHLDQHPHLKNDHQLLQSIPGVGPVVSRYMTGCGASRSYS